MKKTIIALATAASFFGMNAVALAYELPSPVTVNATYGTVGDYAAGEGEVDFSRPSVVEGTITTDADRGVQAWITAGDVANGGTGYGFVLADNMLYAVTRDSYEFRMPFAFVKPGNTVTVRAAYTPNDGIRIDTAAVEQYSRGIVLDFLPNAWVRAAKALVVKVKGVANITVGSWKYTH